MKKIEQAQEILRSIDMPAQQCNEMAALTLLALLQVKQATKWQNASRSSQTVTKNIMAFFVAEYDKTYAANTRETIRRFVLHQFVEAGIAQYNPDNPALPVNSPKAHYSISEEALILCRSFGSPAWEIELKKFLSLKPGLAAKYSKARDSKRIEVLINGTTTISLSPGSHNQLEHEIIKNFAPVFAPGSTVLYVGDTEDKMGHVDKAGIKTLGISFDDHGKFPDVILHLKEKNWLYLIESVTSHGPIGPKRYGELLSLFKQSNSGLVFVTAFLTIADFKKYVADIAWETEVWIAENPTHLIHFNGDRFLGPRKLP